MSPTPDHRDRPARLPWPPVIVVLSLLAGFVVQRLLPLHEPGAHARWLQVPGAAVAACGLLIDLWATLTLRNKRTTIMPHRGARRLVESGPYRLSRNPIYLGYGLLIAGVGIATANVWLLVMVLVACALIRTFAIEPEEKHLRAVFGDDFNRYCERTRRWL